MEKNLENNYIYVCMYIYESLCCILETNTTLQINSTPLKKTDEKNNESADY